MWRLAALVFAIAAALALPLAVRHLRETPPPPDPAVRLILAPPPGAEFGAGDHPFDLAIAPSGRIVVFAATTAGDTRLWRRALDAPRAEPIPGTRSAGMPAFGPDGRVVWYVAEGQLRRMDLESGEARAITGVRTPAGIAVAPDGAVLVGSDGVIQRVDGGTLAPLTSLRAGERAHGFPSWSADAQSFVYLGISRPSRTAGAS
jgi:hypothetical protein